VGGVVKKEITKLGFEKYFLRFSNPTLARPPKEVLGS
jgi:hypothetical protein